MLPAICQGGLGLVGGQGPWYDRTFMTVFIALATVFFSALAIFHFVFPFLASIICVILYLRSHRVHHIPPCIHFLVDAWINLATLKLLFLCFLSFFPPSTHSRSPGICHHIVSPYFIRHDLITWAAGCTTHIGTRVSISKCFRWCHRG